MIVRSTNVILNENAEGCAIIFRAGERMNPYKIPYGFSNYKEIRTGNYIYVDKTEYIEALEGMNSRYLIFLRPRRFGKSLFVSMLHYYYDRNSAAEFQQLFGGTYIGEHRTALANQYYVLRFEFSGLDGSSEEHLQKAFYAKVHAAIRNFIKYYGEDLQIMENDTADSAMLLNDFLSDFYSEGKKLYILIDEYDHFSTNIVENPEFFHSVTGRDGFVRRFYEVLKAHTGTGCVDRMFITGVTSMTLDSLTSGFNIAKNISMNPRVNAMAGFTEAETRKVLGELGIVDSDAVLNRLTAAGYRLTGYPGRKKSGAVQLSDRTEISEKISGVGTGGRECPGGGAPANAEVSAPGGICGGPQGEGRHICGGEGKDPMV